ncbi:MAG: adenylate/guanylate cyclase domain-containing protein [Planctomycetota bacterium]
MPEQAKGRPQMTVLAEIVVTDHEGATKSYRLVEKSVIGRHSDCEIVLRDPMSSRHHCKIERGALGVFYAEDNGSANGTLLNGQALNKRSLIKNGDVLRIGSTELFLRLNAPADATGGLNELRLPATYDPGMSVVRLEDEETSSPKVDFTQQADAQVVSEEEASSSDVAKLKRVTERLRLLVDVGKEMGITLDAGKLLNICLDKLFEVFPQADRGIIVLVGPDGSLPAMLTPEKESNITLDRRKGPMTKVKLRPGSACDNEIRLSRTVANRVRQERQSVLVSDASSDAAGLSMAKFEIKSLLCAPLLVGKEYMGLIELETKSRQQAFTPEDLSILNAVAGQVAVVIRNSDLARDAAAAAAQRENLSRFLSPDLVERMLSGGLSLELGGTEKKGAIFFSDIVNFTKLARMMSARNVVTLLNRYFTVMQNIIFRRGGSIDKCAGDNIMAHWGVVGDMPDFTANAVTAAIEMQIAMFTFNRDEALKNEISLPHTPLGHGIGVNTGMVCAGNIGSDRKIEFTVIGDAANLAARIESLAGRGQVLVGESTWEEIKTRALGIRMPNCPAKNVEKPLPIYSVRGIIPPVSNSQLIDSESPALNMLLLSLPCVLVVGDDKISAMIISISLGSENGARIALQTEKALSLGAKVTLLWTVPEKLSLPKLEGEVEKYSPPQVNDQKAGTAQSAVAGAVPKSGTAILNALIAPGTLVLNVKHLPVEIARWRPGLVLESDLKSHEEMVRA